jgi:hypothetical protein
MEIPYGTHLEVALSFSVTGYPSDSAVVIDADLRKLMMRERSVDKLDKKTSL